MQNILVQSKPYMVWTWQYQVIPDQGESMRKNDSIKCSLFGEFIFKAVQLQIYKLIFQDGNN